MVGCSGLGKQQTQMPKQGGFRLPGALILANTCPLETGWPPRFRRKGVGPFLPLCPPPRAWHPPAVFLPLCPSPSLAPTCCVPDVKVHGFAPHVQIHGELLECRGGVALRKKGSRGQLRRRHLKPVVTVPRPESRSARGTAALWSSLEQSGVASWGESAGGWRPRAATL